MEAAISMANEEIVDYIEEKIAEKTNWKNRKYLLKAWKSNTQLSKLNEFLFACVA